MEWKLNDSQVQWEMELGEKGIELFTKWKLEEPNKWVGNKWDGGHYVVYDLKGNRDRKDYCWITKDGTLIIGKDSELKDTILSILFNDSKMKTMLELEHEELKSEI